MSKRYKTDFNVLIKVRQKKKVFCLEVYGLKAKIKASNNFKFMLGVVVNFSRGCTNCSLI